MTVNLMQSFEIEHCYSCGVAFGMPTELQRQLLGARRGQNFFCPNGHSQHYTGESEAERLKKQLAAKQAELDRVAAAERDAKAWAQRERAERIKAIDSRDRLKKRIGAGVCPHCGRTFKQLAAHMKCKHPKAAGVPR